MLLDERVTQPTDKGIIPADHRRDLVWAGRGALGAFGPLDALGAFGPSRASGTLQGFGVILHQQVTDPADELLVFAQLCGDLLRIRVCPREASRPLLTLGAFRTGRPAQRIGVGPGEHVSDLADELRSLTELEGYVSGR